MEIVIANSRSPAKPFLDRIRPVRGDITAQAVDAIAMIMPVTLDFTGNINETIATASGTNLDEFILEQVYRPRAGDVYALPGFGLPCRHILLGIMPRFRTGFEREDHHLSGACRKILELGRCMLLNRIAFPFFGPEFGYPEGRAARLIVRGITERLDEGFDEIRIVCPDDAALAQFRERLAMSGWREK